MTDTSVFIELPRAGVWRCKGSLRGLVSSI